jgi:hypothetical protein
MQLPAAFNAAAAHVVLTPATNLGSIFVEFKAPSGSNV